jgi:pimeloyl-ACP methyl ester carboxylesterase
MSRSTVGVLARFGETIQKLTFTIAVTCISRLFRSRDQLAAKVRPAPLEAPPPGRLSKFAISSEGRLVDSVLVVPEEQPVEAALLICHGIGEVVDDWLAAQYLLAEQGVASLVFDYSGYGQSSGVISAERCEQNAIAAFSELQVRFPSALLSVLGFSLGSGVGAAILPRLPVHRLVLCAAFTSLREAACCMGLHPKLSLLVSPIWSTQQALGMCQVPVLLVHGERDGLFPVEMARVLHDSCASEVELVLVPENGHDDLYRKPERSYWRRIASFVRSS